MAVGRCVQPAREGKELGGGLEERSGREEGPVVQLLTGASPESVPA